MEQPVKGVIHEVIENIMAKVSDPVWQAEHILREENRTDPWRWYCRICGAEGQDNDRNERDLQAVDHARECRPNGTELGWAESGRLAHVWRYSPRWNK